MTRARIQKLLPLTFLLLACSPSLFAGLVSIDFEGFSDGTFVTTQYPGLTISNSIVLTAGISLNELDFPPRSGLNVASDIGGPLSIDFLTAALDFRGYFTYVQPLTIRGYDLSNNLLATVTSQFSDNTLSSGHPSNELLAITSATGFSRLVITGDTSGGSFTLDDMTYTTGQIGGAIPEPSSIFLTLTGLLLAGPAIRRR